MRTILALILACTFEPTLSAQDPTIRLFRIEVAEKALADLHSRLSATRWPDQIPNTKWQYGTDLATLRDLVHHWEEGYNWRAREKRLNTLPQFKTVLDGIDLHFVHVRSPHSEATPLVLVHGWPGSAFEFQKIIPMLTHPEKHGGKAADAFHVVCPSLPGFAFSSAPVEPGWSNDHSAEVVAKLMARLDYEKYLAQGGDWGASIVRWLADHDGAHCLGAHSNMPMAGRPGNDPWKDVSREERNRWEQRNAELRPHKAYMNLQGTRPLTLGYGLNDSPVGLAAWILDKFWAWSDHRGDLQNSFSKDELVDNIMIYWISGSMPSAMRIYYETFNRQPRPKSMSPFLKSGPPAPLGFALFPKEINVPPRAWVRRQFGKRMVHWSEMPRGGHFAALETPELLAKDIRAFFAKIRP